MHSISCSRKKCFEGCKLQYKYRYIDYIKPLVEKPAEVNLKGQALHETFEDCVKENYTIEEVTKVLDTKVAKFNLNEEQREKFHLDIGVQRWFDFKTKFVSHFDMVEPEYKIDMPMFGEVKLIGYLDLFLKLKDKFVIVDYKTPNGLGTAGFKDQLMLYAYAISKLENIPLEELPEKVKLKVFFPIGECNPSKDKEPNLSTEYEKFLKSVDYTTEDVKELIEKFNKTIADIDAYDWTKPVDYYMPTRLDKSCEWCEYQGQPKSDKFDGCPLSALAGFMPTNEF